MSHKAISLTRSVLNQVNVMTPDADSLGYDVRSTIYDMFTDDYGFRTRIVSDEVIKFIQRCALQLRELVLNCLRYIAPATDMLLSDEKYMNVVMSQYSDALYPQLCSVISANELMDMVYRRVTARCAVISRCYKVIEDKLNNTRRMGEASFKGLQALHTSPPLYEFELDHLWRRYQRRWEETHPQVAKNEPQSPFAKSSKSAAARPGDALHRSARITTTTVTEAFSDKLKRFVREHVGDKMMTIDEFERVTMGWPKTRRTMSEWYDAYVDLYSKQPGHTIKIDDVEIRGSGFKTKGKNHPKVHNQQPTNYFPIKHNRKYMLHTVTRPGTYFIDLMYCGKYTYLVAIEANTRYIYSALCNITRGDVVLVGNEKSAKSYIRALESLMDDGMKPSYIIGDGEMAFASNVAKVYYREHNIQFIPVSRMRVNYSAKHETDPDITPETVPYHTSLALVDRAIRTIRDMAYNMEVPQRKISPSVMEWILHEYNNSYHKTLSKYAGFKVTPDMVHNDSNLEQRICNTIHAANWNVMHEPGFRLASGLHVKVYNDRDTMGKRRRVIRPGEWVIEEWENGKYKVKNNTDGYTCVMPRYKLAPCW